MGLLGTLFRALRGPHAAEIDPAPTPAPAAELPPDVELIAAIGQRMVEVINQSMQIANDSKNVETRRSRVGVARENIERLQELATSYPFIKLQRLADVERSLAEIDRETEEMERPPSWKRYTEVRFQAAPRLATQLATLCRHGELRPAIGELPAFPARGWSPTLDLFNPNSLASAW